MVENFTPIQSNTLSTRAKLRNAVWCLVNKTLFRWTPSRFGIFRKYRVWLTRLFGSKIDYSCSLMPSCKIEYPWNVTMGALSSLGEDSWVYAMAPISVGEKSCIGKDVYLLTGSHDIESPRFTLVTKHISIGSAVWLSTGVRVLPGVSIGDGCVAGASAVLTKDVEPWTVVGGNPAKFIKKRVLEQ
ncbi:MAG: putative colanic acid biosynthesis acetyltransferase [Bacteroidaceae bacterium]|nr:putative colanic acid biosynthesis acetyltransferase [Bacteroidaceae bacterium]